jgi:hypothetical protein
MIKIGDKVKFLNDVGGGKVTGFINKNTVNVEGEDGFEIPYPISQLVNVSAPDETEVGKRTVSENPDEIKVEPEIIKPTGEIINGKNKPDFYFCFVPTNAKNPLSGQIELYFVNDSNFTVLFNYSHIKFADVEAIKQGTVTSNSRMKMDALIQDDLTDLPEFGFQLIYFREEEKEWNQPIVKKFKVNPVKFYKESTFTTNSYFRKNALILQIAPNPLNTELDKLTQDDFQKVVKSKEVKEKSQKKHKPNSPEEVVVDLHISELLDNPEGLSNREMLEIQLEKVESEMNVAIESHVKRIVFIHGVGQGVLKQEVTNLLKRKFKKYYFQDASFKEYGYGATMVTLHR